jgi:hypothetical protein
MCLCFLCVTCNITHICHYRDFQSVQNWQGFFMLTSFSFGHCVVCPSSIYGFWLPPWYLQTLLIYLRYWSLDVMKKSVDNITVFILTPVIITPFKVSILADSDRRYVWVWWLSDRRYKWILKCVNDDHLFDQWFDNF